MSGRRSPPSLDSMDDVGSLSLGLKGLEDHWLFEYVNFDACSDSQPKQPKAAEESQDSTIDIANSATAPESCQPAPLSCAKSTNEDLGVLEITGDAEMPIDKAALHSTAGISAQQSNQPDCQQGLQLGCQQNLQFGCQQSLQLGGQQGL